MSETNEQAPKQLTENQEQQEPTSVRESITDAIAEVREDAEPEPASPSNPETSLESQPRSQSKFHDVVNKLPPEHRKIAMEREQEIEREERTLQGRLKVHEDIEKVLAPRLDTIKSFGITPAQTVDKLFQWFEALGHPDFNTRSSAFRKLASNFGVDLSQAEVKPRAQSYNPRPAQPQNTAFLANFEGELSKFASGHKHYQRVRSRMHQLLSSGAIPLIDSPHTAGLDLERAYELAVQLDKGLSGNNQASAPRQSTQKLQSKGLKAPSNTRIARKNNETVRGSIVRAFAQAK